MRWVVIAFCFVLPSFAHAQEQEQKLLDRLLRPDMSLQNHAQGKEFATTGSTTTKTVRTKSFLFFKRKPERAFWNTRQATTKEFTTNAARDEHTSVNVATRREIPKAKVAYPTATYRTREARDAKKHAQASEFAGSRAFLVQGKSQKALSQQDRPLTIDEVRELLNKNK